MSIRRRHMRQGISSPKASCRMYGYVYMYRQSIHDTCCTCAPSIISSSNERLYSCPQPPSRRLHFDALFSQRFGCVLPPDQLLVTLASLASSVFCAACSCTSSLFTGTLPQCFKLLRIQIPPTALLPTNHVYTARIQPENLLTVRDEHLAFRNRHAF